MPELTIHDDSVQKLSALLGRVLDPTFHTRNRFNHGYAQGVIDSLDVMHGVEHPSLTVAGYSEEITASANLGLEALSLIAQQIEHFQTQGIPSAVLWEKMEKLIEVWRVNTRTQATMPALKPQKRVQVFLQCGERRYEVSHRDQLLDLPAVCELTEDIDGLFFRRLCLDRHAEGKIELVSEFIDAFGNNSTVRIGELTGDIDALNMPHVENKED